MNMQEMMRKPLKNDKYYFISKNTNADLTGHPYKKDLDINVFFL